MSQPYPSADDLGAKIAACGVIDTTGKNFGRIKLGRKLSAAIAAWEQETEWHPFLAESDGAGNPVLTARAFDPPGPTPRQNLFPGLRGGGRVLFLEGGLTAAPPSLTVSGMAYTEGQQYWCRPNNAVLRGRPITRIEFLMPIVGQPQCVQITGSWGYTLSCSDDVFEAILDEAARLCVPEIALNISEGLYELKEGDELRRFAGSGTAGPLAREAKDWGDNFQDTLGNYRRAGL